MSQYWPYFVVILLAAVVFWLRRIYSVLRGPVERRPKRPILSTTSLKMLAIAFVIFAVVMIIPHNQDQITMLGGQREWESLSYKQRQQFCARLAAASSKGDSEQVYCSALNAEYVVRQGSGLSIAGVVRHVDPGNRILPEHHD